MFDVEPIFHSESRSSGPRRLKDGTVRGLTWAVLMAASDSGIGSGIFDGSFNILAVLLFSGFQSDDHSNDSYYITHKV